MKPTSPSPPPSFPPSPPPSLHLEISDDASPLLPPDVNPERLRQLAETALPRCLAVAKTSAAVLHQLEAIEITLVTDAEIAHVHGEFLNDPTPTDVITFHHGEILISIETAARQAAEYGQNQPVAREIALYLIHGLLHLAGWDDHAPAEAAEMAGLQESILQEAEHHPHS